MDIRTRILAARLAEKIDENPEYSERLRLKNTSYYKRQDNNNEREGGK